MPEILNKEVTSMARLVATEGDGGWVVVDADTSARASDVTYATQAEAQAAANQMNSRNQGFPGGRPDHPDELKSSENK